MDGMETLEVRLLLSVTLRRGRTIVRPSADSRVVYVSSLAGNDRNNGLSPQQPVKTIEKAKSLLRDGSPDHLLLRRGETFPAGLGFLDIAGRSEQEPLYIGAYGKGAKPILDSGNNDGVEFYGDSLGNTVIQGLAFRGRGTGVFLYGDGENLLLEDVDIQGFEDNIVLQGESSAGMRNVKLRRSVVAHAHSSERSQGFYANNTHGIVIEHNLFDHNGWRDDRNDDEFGATVFNHNIYIDNATSNVVLRNNIIARASSHGAQLRSGGIADGNLFVANPIGLLIGGGDDPTPGGVEGRVTNNVFTEGVDINDEHPRSFALDIYNARNVLIEGNLIFRDAAPGPNGHTIEIHGRGVSVRNNIMRWWDGGIQDDGEDTVFASNSINRKRGFRDPNRSVAGFAASVLRLRRATLSRFLTLANQNWGSSLYASSVNHWLREGFQTV